MFLTDLIKNHLHLLKGMKTHPSDQERGKETGSWVACTQWRTERPHGAEKHTQRVEDCPQQRAGKCPKLTRSQKNAAKYI